MTQYTEKQVQELGWFAHYCKKHNAVRYSSPDCKKHVMFFRNEYSTAVYEANPFETLVMTFWVAFWQKPFDYEEICAKRT